MPEDSTPAQKVSNKRRNYGVVHEQKRTLNCKNPIVRAPILARRFSIEDLAKHAVLATDT